MSGEKDVTVRVASSSSPPAESATQDESEKLARLSPRGEEFQDPKAPDDKEVGHAGESTAMLPEQQVQAEPAKTSIRTAIIWMMINTLATVAIVRPCPCSQPGVPKPADRNTLRLRSSRTKPFSPTHR